MKNVKSKIGLLGMVAMAGLGNGMNLDGSYSLDDSDTSMDFRRRNTIKSKSRKGNPRSHEVKKQKKVRAKSKNARKARRKNRK